jgi:hypothetical protein
MKADIIKKNRMIYVGGSLRNPTVMKVANKLRKINPNWEVFDSWISPGPRADDYFRDYCNQKGLSYKEALKDPAAKHIFEFDLFHINRATDFVLVMKAGKSAHLELGYFLGRGGRGYILFDETPKRYDLMLQFANDIFFNFNDLAKELKKYD